MRSLMNWCVMWCVFTLWLCYIITSHECQCKTKWASESKARKQRGVNNTNTRAHTSEIDKNCLLCLWSLISLCLNTSVPAALSHSVSVDPRGSPDAHFHLFSVTQRVMVKFACVLCGNSSRAGHYFRYSLNDDIGAEFKWWKW